jgi:lysozyme
MTQTLGIDVSTYQDAPSTPQRIDWKKAKDKGTVFAFIRAGYGKTADDDFAYNWQAAEEAGILRGAYWYITWDVDHIQQAQMLSMAGMGGELPCAADYESRSFPAGLIPGTMRQKLSAFLKEVQRITQKAPVIYTSPSYWLEFGSPNVIWAQYPLWIANYNVEKPTVPAPWKKWNFWQFTPKGPGKDFGMESFGLDMDWFNGTEDELMKFCGIQEEEPDVPPDIAARFEKLEAWAVTQGYVP